MRNPLAPQVDAYSCGVAAVQCGAMDLKGNLVDASLLSDKLLQRMIDHAIQGDPLVLELLKEQERRIAQ